MILSPSQILLAGLCSVLTLSLIYELNVTPAAADVPVRHWQPPDMSGTLVLAPLLPPMASFHAIDDRPLFNPARKPVAVAAAKPAASLPPPTGISLIGVIIDGDRRLAMLRMPTSPLAVSFSVGGFVDGWQVSVIEPDHIVLHAGTTDFNLALNTVHSAAPRPADRSTGGQTLAPGSPQTAGVPASDQGANNNGTSTDGGVP